MPPQVGNLIIVMEPNLPPEAWLLGRILKLSSGEDGVAWLATLHTKRGMIQRLVKDLAVLPSGK